MEALRAVLKKEGCTDIKFELHRNSDFDFRMIVDGKETGVFWRTISPREPIRGGSRRLGIGEAWESCIAKQFPGYSATDMEEACIEAA